MAITLPLVGTSSAPLTFSIQELEEYIGRYFPPLVDSVKACLAVCGSMALKDRTRPLSLILETPSGYGKSTVLEMFFPDGKEDPVGKYLYRSDKFTPKAFVSHAANKTEAALTKDDLLPKLRGMILNTKELAPILRGRETDLVENFAMLITVLDGMGLTSDTGMRGQRGYPERIIFNWLGATTPLPPKTHRLMSQLGTRLLFYEVPAEFPSEEELTEYAKREDAGEAPSVCRALVGQFLLDFFQRHPIGSVPQDTIHIPQELAKEIARWARYLAQARAEVKCEKGGKDEKDGADGTDWTPISASKPEAPHKIVNYFKDLARGHALIEGREEVNESDLKLIAHVSVSSIPGHLRPIVRLLMRGGKADVVECANECRVSRKTARRYMLELGLLGIGTIRKGSPASNEADIISLVPSLAWLKDYGS
jgi:hypothetical protein